MNLYSIYKKSEKLYANAPQKLSFLNGRALPPLQVVFELTYRCNLTCEFCYQRREEDQLGIKYGRDELTLDEIKAVVDQTMPWTLIILSGGEIFIRKDTLDLLQYITSKRRCHIVTNGTYVTPEIAERLVSMGMTSVGISIEGPEEIHDRIRGRKTFAKATGAAQMLVEQKRKQGKRFPLVNLKTTVTHDNVGHLTEIVDLTERLNADYCSFQIMNTSIMISGMYFYDELDHYRAAPPPITDFPLDALQDQLLQLAKRKAESKAKVRFSPDLTPDQVMDHYANHSNMHDYLCAAPWTGLNIAATGEVFPCFNYRIGSVRQEPLMKLWNNEKFRDFRQSLMTNGQFSGCRGCCDLVPKTGAQAVRSRIDLVPSGSEYSVTPGP